MAYTTLKKALIGAIAIGASSAVLAADPKPTMTGASAMPTMPYQMARLAFS